MSPFDYSLNTITLNNLGAGCIDSGDYRRSIEFLSAAFQMTKQQLRDHSSTEQDHEKSVYRHSVSTFDTWMTKNENDSLNDIGTTTDTTGEFVYRNPLSSSDSIDNSSISSNGEFVYTDPIYIPSHAYSHDLLIPIVITFNLGLAYYLLATTDQTVDRLTLLRSSLRLYQHSFRLQRTRGRASHSPHYFMAVINNVGVVYSNLGETQSADQCFQQLLTLLMYMNTKMAAPSSSNNSSNNNTSSGYEAFFQNTSRVLKEQTPCAGAA
jgi:tetratricopeptide (TPR) repeat protein